MNPQIGDDVVVRYLAQRERLSGLVVQGSGRRTLTAVGKLGVTLVDGKAALAVRYAVINAASPEGGAQSARTILDVLWTGVRR